MVLLLLFLVQDLNKLDLEPVPAGPEMILSNISLMSDGYLIGIGQTVHRWAHDGSLSFSIADVNTVSWVAFHEGFYIVSGFRELQNAWLLIDGKKIRD